jgi:predicted MFS family arabinose efflux permease
MNRALSPRALLLVLTGLNLFNYLDRFVLAAVRTPMAAEFKVDYERSAQAFTMFMIGYFITAPFFGYLGDRCPRKWLIAVGIFVWSLGTLLTGMAQTFTALLLFRVLVGLGEASYATISPSLISDVFPTERRNNALTVFYVAIPVGSALGYILGGQMSAHFGWRNAFICAGAPGLLLALILLPFQEPKRGQAEARNIDGEGKPSVRDVLQLFRLPDYNLVVWGYVAYTFALGAFGFWGQSFLEKIHGMDTKLAGTYFGAALVLAGLLGTFLGGLTATAWQRRSPAGYAWVLALSVLAAVPISLAAFLVPGKLAAFALLSIAMFLLFLSTGPVNTLILETVPFRLRSSAMAGSIFMIHMFGDIWSPQIVGHIADHAGGDLRRGVLILPLALLASATLWFALAWKTQWQRQTPVPRP